MFCVEGNMAGTTIFLARITFLISFLFVSIIFSTQLLLSHSGGLNSQGCHGGSKPYSCHRSSSEMVPSTSGGYRLRCNAGSRSKDCLNPPSDSQPRREKSVTAPKNGYVSGDMWFCKDGYITDYYNKKCIRN